MTPLNVLIEHPWAASAALAALVLVGPVLGAWAAGRPRLTWTLTACSLLPVAALTLVPSHRPLYARCAVAWQLPTPGRVELMANVLLFVLPVLLAGVALRRPLTALVAGSALSLAIEATQAAVTVLGRSCDTNDWLSNTIGALIGAALAAVALGLAPRRPAAPERDPRHGVTLEFSPPPRTGR